MNIKPHSILNNGYTVPTFKVTDADGNNIPTLQHCFIVHLILDANKPPVTLRGADGGIYTTVYDNVKVPRDTKDPEASLIRVIASFQKHTYGSFAVIRNYKPHPKHPNPTVLRAYSPTA